MQFRIGVEIVKEVGELIVVQRNRTLSKTQDGARKYCYLKKIATKHTGNVVSEKPKTAIPKFNP